MAKVLEELETELDSETQPRGSRHRNVKVTNLDASIITCKDGTGTRYVTHISYDPAHGLPFSWRKDEAMLVTKPGVVDDLARALERAWPTMQFSVGTVRLRQIR